MKHVLIVHAHHEPKSFCSALKDTARSIFEASGARVQVSDLYAEKFNPGSARNNFTTVADPDFLKQQQEEKYATTRNVFLPELDTDIPTISSCPLFVFVF